MIRSQHQSFYNQLKHDAEGLSPSVEFLKTHQNKPTKINYYQNNFCWNENQRLIRREYEGRSSRATTFNEQQDHKMYSNLPHESLQEESHQEAFFLKQKSSLAQSEAFNRRTRLYHQKSDFTASQNFQNNLYPREENDYYKEFDGRRKKTQYLPISSRTDLHINFNADEAAWSLTNNYVFNVCPQSPRSKKEQKSHQRQQQKDQMEALNQEQKGLDEESNNNDNNQKPSLWNILDINHAAEGKRSDF